MADEYNNEHNSSGDNNWVARSSGSGRPERSPGVHAENTGGGVSPENMAKLLLERMSKEKALGFLAELMAQCSPQNDTRPGITF